VDPRINYLLLCNTMLGNFIAGTSSRIFGISLPTVANALDTDIAGVSWALISFSLSNLGFVLIFSRIGDMFGREKLYSVGFGIFAVGSLLCGLSQNILQLVQFRMLQGMGAAMTQSVGRALAAEAVPDDQGSKVQGLMTTAFHTGFLLGPTIGGLIIDYIHWRVIFFFLVPLATLSGILAFINRNRSIHLVKRQPIDYLGSALLVATSTSLVLLLNPRIREALGPEISLLTYVGFPIFFLAFLTRELKASSPIINLHLFKIRLFTFSCITLLIVSFTHGLQGFLLPFYLQEVLHLSPTFMGILFMSAPIFTVTLAPISGHVADRIGPRIPATAGLIMMFSSILVGTLLRPNSHWALPALMLAFGGLGNGLFNAPNHGAIMGSVPKVDRGFANGTIQVCFNLGHMMGISFATFLMTTIYQYYTGQSGGATTDDPQAFVSSLNYTFRIALIIITLALGTSLMRGQKREEAAMDKGSLEKTKT